MSQEPGDILSLSQPSPPSEARNSARPTGEKCQNTKRISCAKPFSRLRRLPLRYYNLPKPKEFSWISTAAPIILTQFPTGLPMMGVEPMHGRFADDRVSTSPQHQIRGRTIILLFS